MDSDWKYKRAFLTEEEAAYLSDIWGCALKKNAEDVLVRQGQGRKRTMALLRDMVRLEENEASSVERFASLERVFDRYPGRDLYFSPNTFRFPKKGVKPNARETSLFAVYTWALDIDYKRAYEIQYNAALSSWTWQKEAELAAMKPMPPLFYYEGVLRPLMEELGIPEPNWIEYGHQLRLIYVLAEPVYASGKGGKQMLAAIKCIMRRFSDMLNDRDPFIGAEPQKIASCFRVPGSVNKKDGARVHVARISEKKWAVQEILSEWMPDIPDWYEAWKARRKLKKVPKENKTLPAILRVRLEAFKKMRVIEGIPREKLTFLYGNTLAQLEPDRDIMEALLLFNRGFRVPLSEREIRSKLRLCGIRVYKYSVAKIAETLGLKKEVLADYGVREMAPVPKGTLKRSATDSIASLRKKRAVKLAEQIDLCVYLRSQGLTQKAVAEKMRVSVRSVQRYEKTAKDKTAMARIRRAILACSPRPVRENAAICVKTGPEAASRPLPPQPAAGLPIPASVMGSCFDGGTSRPGTEPWERSAVLPVKKEAAGTRAGRAEEEGSAQTAAYRAGWESLPGAACPDDADTGDEEEFWLAIQGGWQAVKTPVLRSLLPVQSPG